MISPIETRYDGRLFRSRTEARWAVFFNELRLDYDYEKEGFKLKHGWYLPDFWLSDLDCWIEIKGQYPNEKEKKLCIDLFNESHKKVYLFVGSPEYGGSYRCDEELPISGFLYGDNNDHPFDGQRFCKCSVCGKIGIAWTGCNQGICWHDPWEQYLYKQCWTDSLPIFKKAVEKSLSARFE